MQQSPTRQADPVDLHVNVSVCLSFDDTALTLVFWLNFFLDYTVNENLVTRLNMFASFAPIVATGVGKESASSIETCTGD